MMYTTTTTANADGSFRLTADDPYEQARQRTLSPEAKRWEAFTLCWRRNFPNRRLDPEAWRPFVLKVYRSDVLFRLLEEYALQTAGKSDFDKVPSEALIERRYWDEVKTSTVNRSMCSVCKGRRQLFMLWNFSTELPGENPVDFRCAHWRDFGSRFGIVSMACPVCNGRHHDYRELDRYMERSLPYYVQPDSDDYPVNEPLLNPQGKPMPVFGEAAILARLRANDAAALNGGDAK